MSIGSASIGEFAIGEEPAAGATTFNETVSESLVLTDTVTEDSLGVLVDETLTFTTSVTLAYGALLRDLLKLNDQDIVDLIMERTMSDQLRFRDDVLVVYAELITDALSFADTPTFVREWVGKLRDTLNLPDSAAGAAVYERLVSSALAFADLAARWEYETLSDTLDFAETLAGLATMYDKIVESIALGDTSSYLAVFTGSLSEPLNFADSVDHTAEFQALLQDGLFFAVWDGHDQHVYSGYVVNPAVGGVTEYLNYNFNSIAKIGSNYYGAADSGLYLLDGDTDAGVDITTRVKMGAFDFGTGYKSRVEHAYVGVRTNGKLVLKTFADDGKERWYETQALHSDLNTQRAKLGRGVTSRYWQFEITNRNGEALELEQIEFLPVVLTRRV